MYRGIRWLCAAIWVVSAVSVAQAQPAVGDLSLRAPEQIVLGEVDSVEITAEGPPGQRLLFFANVGEIQAPAEVGDTVQARYTPPTARFPQVAIVVVATEDYRTVDWISIPLHGSPTVSVAFEARSRVTVRVGGREFGPVNTDRSGEAEIPLVVPPGVSEAMAFGVDHLGNTREQVVPLNPPPFDRLLSICVPGAAGALYFALGADGLPLGSAEFEQNASVGELLAPRALSPGTYFAEYRPTSGNSIEDGADLTAALAGETESCHVDVERVSPDGIELELSESEVSPGVAGVDIILQLRYPASGARLAVVPTLSAEFGTISPLEPAGDGRFRARWRMPSELPDVEELTLRVRAGSGLEAAATLRLGRPRGPFNVGISAGFLTNFGRVAAPYAALSLTYALPIAGTHSLLLGLRCGFWLASDASEIVGGTEQLQLSLLAIPALARAGLRLELGSIDLSATLDGGVVIAYAEIESPSTGAYGSTDVTWALGGTLGGATQIGPGALGLEVGYLHAPRDGDIQGNTAGLHMALGYTLEIPVR